MKRNLDILLIAMIFITILLFSNTIKVTNSDFENEYKYGRYNRKDRERRTGHKS